MMRKSIGFALLVVGMSSAANAQSDEAVAAAMAMALTPAGSFVSVSSAALGHGATGLGLDYARFTGDGDRNSFGAHADWSAFRATLGVGKQSGLDDVWMAGLSAGRGLMSLGFVSMGAEADVGFGRIKNEVTDATLNAMTAGVRVPFALSTGSDGVTLTPYLAPGGFYGRLSSGGVSESGFRASLNGGVRFAFANGVALDVGAQRVFIDDAETLFGAGLSFSRR